MSSLIYNLESECETHITLSGENFDELKAWNEKNGFKFTHILLSSGEHASQPMISRTDEKIEVAGWLKYIYPEVIWELRNLGFEVNRVKLEVPPWASIVPQTIMDITQEHADGNMYFESHFKIELETEQIAALEAFAKRFNAHVSKNAFKKKENKEERFITIRSYHSSEEHDPIFCLIEDRLRFYGFKILEFENEYVIYDSNFDLDKGWDHK